MLMIFASTGPALLPRFRRIHFKASRDDQKRPARVGGENRIPLPHRQLFELRRLVVGGIVHENVDAAQFAPSLFHHRPNTGLIGHIAAQRKCPHTEPRQVDDRLLRFPRRVPEGDGYIRASLRQCERRCSSQSPRRTRNKRSFALKRFFAMVLHGGILPFSLATCRRQVWASKSGFR